MQIINQAVIAHKAKEAVSRSHSRIANRRLGYETRHSDAMKIAGCVIRINDWQYRAEIEQLIVQAITDKDAEYLAEVVEMLDRKIKRYRHMSKVTAPAYCASTHMACNEWRVIVLNTISDMTGAQAA